MFLLQNIICIIIKSNFIDTKQWYEISIITSIQYSQI